MALTREQILAADDLTKEAVDIPEWGDSVFVRTMTASERDRYEQEVIKLSKGELQDIRARLAVHTVCDESGAPLFTAADIPALGGKSAPALDRIFAVAIRLNRVTKTDVDELAAGGG